MLHYVHQLVSNFICLWFGTEQVVYSGFLELFRWKQQPAVAENNAMKVVRVNKNSSSSAGYGPENQNNALQDVKKTL